MPVRLFTTVSSFQTWLSDRNTRPCLTISFERKKGCFRAAFLFYAWAGSKYELKLPLVNRNFRRFIKNPGNFKPYHGLCIINQNRMILRKLLFAAFLLCFGGTLSHAQSFGWAKAIQGNFFNSKVIADRHGNVYTAGHFSGTIDADMGPGVFPLTSPDGDVFVVKTNAEGKFVWAKKYAGDAGSDVLESIAIDDSANLYLTGYFSNNMVFAIGSTYKTLKSAGASDVFIAKLDSSGNAKWATSFGQAGNAGGADDLGTDISVDQAGNVYITGYFWETVDFDPGPGTEDRGTPDRQSAFVLKLSSAGSFVWAKHFPGTANIYGLSIAVDNSANVYVGGFYNDTADFDPGPGTHTMVASGSSAAFICKLDANGDFDWVKPAGVQGHHVTVSKDDLYVSGDGNVHRFNAQGTKIWTKTFGTALITRLVSDKNGSLYMFGTFSGLFDFDPGPGSRIMISNSDADIYILKLDHSGNFLWVKRIGSNPGGFAFQDVYDVYVDENLGVHASGIFTGRPDFDPGTDSFFLEDGDTSKVSLFTLKYDPAQNPLYTDNDMGNLLVYPNPTNGIVHFGLENGTGNIRIRVMNTAGQVVLESVDDSGLEPSVDLSSLSPGMYWIELQNDLVQTTAKVVRR